MKLASRTLALAFTLALTNLFTLAQAAPKPATDAATEKAVAELKAASAKSAQDSAPRSRPNLDALPIRTFYLKNATQASDANEIITAIRNLVSTDDRVLMVPNQNAIVMRAPAEDFALVQQVLDNLDRPKKSYRLTYTITETDGEKRVGVQHYSMDMIDGQRANLQQGSKIPVPTGTYSAGGASGAATGVQTSYTYEDVGITFNATLVPQAAGARLQSDIEQNGVANSGSVSGLVVKRDSTLKGAYFLTLNKPLVLGTMDLPGSTHHLQIEALIEPLP